MKTLGTWILIFLNSTCFAQTQPKKADILKSLFAEYTIKHYSDKEVLETTVWGKHATIPIKKCYAIKLDNGIVALAFNIYLSEDSKQYQYMVEEGVYNMIEISESNSFKGGGERLIQVLFYDTKNDKFLGKGKDFPLKGFSWVPTGMGDMTTINEIHSFDKLDASMDACILNITECPSCESGLHYVFKLHNGEILTSEGVSKCYEKIYVNNNKLIMKVITNCYNHMTEGESALTEDKDLFSW